MADDNTRLKKAEARVKKCHLCNGRGVVHSGQEDQADPKIEICSCVLEMCCCSGIVPYQCFTEDDRMEWCVCGPWRKRAAQAHKWLDQVRPGKTLRHAWTFLDAFSENSADGRPVTEAKQLRYVVMALLDNVLDGKNVRGPLFWGTPGSGKTMLATILLNHLILQQGKKGEFINLGEDFFPVLRDSYRTGSPTFGRGNEILDRLSSTPFLVIDEIGVERDTEWEQEMLYHLINRRCESQLLTIITMNGDPHESLKELSQGRIYSRICEMCQFHKVTLSDWRQVTARTAGAM